ncbi:PAS domain S-box protein [Roseibium aggregatum]|uniref:PAS domain S-box protein n=1 Tax=Roseibium aggregatum TaxID=187304 RepID=A0A926S7K4_9HYPH|nr:PAS domain S-box protein [Roseibium aggregatum]MBD1548380.1 PAS domain S-box protein [Roseibium aggregatum]
MNEHTLTDVLNMDLEKSFGPLDECVVVTRPDRRILFVNRAAEEVFGYSREELIGATSVNLYANPKEFTANRKIYDDVDSLSTDNRFTVRLRRKNGCIFTAEVVSAALYDGASDPVGFLFIARDITDRLALEAMLNDAVATLEDALETISDGFAVYDKDDRLVICNEKYREIYAHSAPAMVPGATFREILEYGLDRNEYDLGNLSREEWLQIRMDRHLAADGEVIEQALGDGSWLQIAERLTLSGGRAGIRTDITDLKAAQSLAENALHNLSNLADNLSCSITEYDLDGNCIFLNETSATWFGGRKEELLGTQLRERLPAKNRTKSDPLFKRALAGEKISFETRNDFIDGQARDVWIDYIPKKNAAGEFSSLVVLATDITDIKQAQAQAEKAHRDLSDLTNNLSCAILEYDLDANCVFVNETMAQWHDCGKESLLGIPARTKLDSDYMKQSERYLQRAFNGEPATFETTYAYPDGITRNVQVEFTPKRDAAGNQVGVIVYVNDISDLMTAQAQTEQAHRDLSDLADNLSCAIAEIDLNGICVFSNETNNRWLGGKDQVGSSMVQVLNPEFLKEALPYYKRALKGENAAFETVYSFPDRGDRNIHVEYTPKSNANGDRIGVILYVTDVTDLKTAQAQTEKAHRDLTDMTDNLSCAIIEMDLEGNCVFINTVFADWIGKPREELLGTKVRDTLAAESRNKSEPYFQRALKGEHIYFEDRIRYPTGIEREVSIEYTPKLNASGEHVGIIIYSTDITERKQTERTLAKLYSITSTRELTTDQKINQILKLGCEHFGLPFGIISRIIEDRYSVIYAESPNGEIEVGASFDLGETYCAHTLKADKPVAIAHTKTSALAHHPCYEKFRLEAYIGAPLLVDGERYGTINFTASEPRERPFSQTEQELIRQFADWIGNEIAREQDHIALMEAQVRLERIASIDDLTGVLNRRAFMERAATEIARFRRTGRKFTAVMIDIDHFKSINDTFGHSAGDDVLKKFAGIISDALRAVDVFGRVGGEEFCIILDSTEGDDALMVCERIRQQVVEQCQVEPITWDITCSMGLATVAKADVEFSTLMQHADQALYRAKEAGRNRCLFFKAEDFAPETAD